MQVKSLLLTSALILGFSFFATSQEHFHAQCKVIWLVGIPCRDVYVALVNQINAWNTRASCKSGGETCLYELVFVSPIRIRAKHTSPWTKEVDDLSFTMDPLEATVCRFIGDSVSESWADLTDNGTSYCSLQNLIEGSGLSQVDGYRQYTNEWICLDYATANCSIY